MARPLPLLRRAESTTPLPPLYARWIEGLLGAPVPAETDATCADCTMCREPPATERFDAKTRCCTYTPTIPNFLVGAILADRALAGRQSIGERMRGEGVTPWGLDPPALFKLVYAQAWSAFGRAEGLLCPHYLADLGECGIWAHRNSVCATYFCVHVRGSAGEHFWDQARKLLLDVEEELATVCLLDLGLEPSALEATYALRSRPALGQVPEGISQEAIDGRADPRAHRRAWGRWEGREEELYRRCFEIVAPMSWRDVVSRCGPQVLARARLLESAHAELRSPELPPRLRLADLRVTPHPDGRGLRTVWAGHTNRAIVADDELFSVLMRFRGQPVREALHEIQADLGIAFDEASLWKFYNLGILTTADST
jgi:hypothetical protein